MCTFSFFPEKMASVVDKEKVWEFNLRDVLRWCELMVKYQVRCTASSTLSCTLNCCVRTFCTNLPYDGSCLIWSPIGPHFIWLHETGGCIIKIDMYVTNWLIRISGFCLVTALDR